MSELNFAEKVKKLTDRIRTNLDLIETWTSMKVPGFDFISDRTDFIEANLEDIRDLIEEEESGYESK